MKGSMNERRAPSVRVADSSPVLSPWNSDLDPPGKSGRLVIAPHSLATNHDEVTSDYY